MVRILLSAGQGEGKLLGTLPGVYGEGSDVHAATEAVVQKGVGEVLQDLLAAVGVAVLLGAVLYCVGYQVRL